MSSTKQVVAVCFLTLATSVAYSGFGGVKGQDKKVQPVTNKAQGADHSVNVTKVIEKTTPENTIVYQISYDYDFKGRTTVHVKGIGIVPAKGQFSYMTSEPQLEVRESADGPVIAMVQLEETIRTQGSDSTEFPEESKFPTFFRSGSWNAPATFPGAAIKVIQKYFPSGYNPRQTGQVNYYVTTYRNLQVPNPNNDSAIQNLRSQVAIVVSQPYDQTTNQFTYRIQFIARDRPRMSTTWRYGSDRHRATEMAAQQFIDALIGELGASGGTGP
ncbi:MAG TPA: hypothetical protein VJU86_21525 [Pyrinomonadaceae bacterium]|nr:hypothetical protein [Pyrinomonadaceae bacterium]